MRKNAAQNYHVLMGDVTGSSKLSSAEVAKSVRQVTETANDVFADRILSPLTVTLGDEFQGVMATAIDTLDLMLYLHRYIFEHDLPELHFAWVYGPIETQINAQIAHGMLGPALTRARKLLTRKDRQRPDIQVDLHSPHMTKIMQNTLFAMTTITNDWKQKDAALITDLIEGDEIKAVAARHNRDTSSIYRRRETLMIAPYIALSEAARATAILHDETKNHA